MPVPLGNFSILGQKDCALLATERNIYAEGGALPLSIACNGRKGVAMILDVEESCFVSEATGEVFPLSPRQLDEVLTVEAEILSQPPHSVAEWYDGECPTCRAPAYIHNTHCAYCGCL